MTPAFWLVCGGVAPEVSSPRNRVRGAEELAPVLAWLVAEGSIIGRGSA